MDNYKKISAIFGATSFHSRIEKWNYDGWSPEAIRDINLFLKRDSFCINEKNRYSETALLSVLSGETCPMDIVRLLLNYGADVNCPDDVGCTPLFYAVTFKRDESIIRILIENGADVQARNMNGRTSLCSALGRGASIDVIKLLLEGGCHPNACERHGGSILECVSCCSEAGLQDGVLDLLIEAGADVLRFGTEGQSPVCLALRAGAGVRDIRRLLELGASLNACTKHASVWLCATDFEAEAFEMRRFRGEMWGMPLKADVFELLREAGASANSVNADGKTPLQLALLCCNYETQALKVLIDLPGVDFSIKDQENRNLLHLTVKNYPSECKESAVKLLIERGVDVTELDSKRQTPLHIALLWSEIGVIKLLLKHGSPLNGECVRGTYPLKTAFLCDRGLDIIQLLLFAGAKIGAMTELTENSILVIALECLINVKNIRNQCRKKLDELKLLVKHSFLENPNFSIVRLIWRHVMDIGCALVEELIGFANDCSREVEVMKSKNVGDCSLFNFAKMCLPSSIATCDTPILCMDEFNQLLRIMAENPLSLYFELISYKVGKATMKINLQELQVYAVKSSSGLSGTNENIYLNYDCLCVLIQFLSAVDSLRLILAYTPGGCTHGNKDNHHYKGKRSYEYLMTNLKKHQKLLE